MNVVLLNGARQTEIHIDTAAFTIQNLMEQAGWAVSAHTLREKRIGYCIGCFDCWIKTPGQCIIKDENRGIAEEIINSSLLVLVTPVTFGGYSSELKRMVDHLIPLISPFFRRIDGETHHRQRYDRYPGIIGIGFMPKPNLRQSEIFHALVQANAVNMGNVASRSHIWPGNTTQETITTDFLTLLRQHMEIA